MRKSVFLKIFFGIVLVATIFFALTHFKPSELLDQLQNLGSGAPFVFITAYVLATVCFLPGSLLTLGAGVLFGVVKGFFAVSVGSTLGATGAFLVGRYFARNWVASKIQNDKRFKAMDEAVAKQGLKIVFLIRLSPIFPFNLVNYAFGLTKVSLRNYILASWTGMIPGTLLYVYLGSVAGDLAKLGVGGRSHSPLEWVLYGAGLIATLFVTLYVTRLAKQSLNTVVPAEAGIKPKA